MKTHIGYWIAGAIIAVALYFGFNSWRSEHDARLVAEVTSVQAKAQIEQLRSDMQANKAASDAQIADLKKQRIAVKTPAQAVAAIPALTDIPLNIRTDVSDPTRASVDVLPLFQELNSCKQDAVALQACTFQSEKKDEIIKVDENLIAVLKKKPSFWHRIGSQMKSGAFWMSAGVVIAKVVLK